jgi:exodeoxyribonuclease VII large subunit
MRGNIPVYSVSELSSYLKEILERDPLLGNVWVRGEISNYKLAVSGHLYFTLKDQESCLRTVMFHSRARKLNFPPEDGLAVRVRGYVTIFERNGIYQLYAEEMELDGTGTLYLAFNRLKEKLRQEGLFDARHKKKLPLFPRRVGLVTSPTGAVIQDMIGIINRRWPGIEIIFVPVAVQGETAPGEIAQGIFNLNRLGNVDVIIVGRGGGSIEELWAFNTPEVAYSIFQAQVPVISAVGHETDFTISDFTADLRAPTPSAAAELVVPVKKDIYEQVVRLQKRLGQIMAQYLNQHRQQLNSYLQRPVFRRPVQEICGRREQIIDFTVQRLKNAVRKQGEEKERRLAVQTGRLKTLSPLATLARGYSICLRQHPPEVLRDAAAVKEGDRVEVKLFHGKLDCQVAKSTRDCSSY